MFDRVKPSRVKLRAMFARQPDQVAGKVRGRGVDVQVDRSAEKSGIRWRGPPGAAAVAHERARSRLITIRWIWLVPSKICITLVSRM